jgi:hypothetical protein
MNIDSKYNKWYFNIIQAARDRNLTSRKKATELLGYVEKHHILPRSLGGSDRKENLVYLSAREHFVCHWLLFKMTTDQEKSKMANAWFRMCQKNEFQSRNTSKNYESARKAFSEHNPFKSEDVKNLVSERMTANNPMKDPNIAKKVSNSMKGKMAGENNPFYGKTHSDKTKADMSLNKKGKSNPNKGKTRIELYGEEEAKEISRKQSMHRKGQLTGDDNPAKRSDVRAAISVKKTGIKQPTVTCPVCNMQGGKSAMVRYHFNNCKNKP